jgi:hypothetical protein
MSSSRLILIFLGFILVIIVILTSGQIAGALKKRFGNVIPQAKVISENITPTPTEEPTPTETPFYNGKKGGSVNNEIPATGPADIVYLLLGGSMATGFVFKKLSSKVKS